MTLLPCQTSSPRDPSVYRPGASVVELFKLNLDPKHPVDAGLRRANLMRLLPMVALAAANAATEIRSWRRVMPPEASFWTDPTVMAYVASHAETEVALEQAKVLLESPSVAA